MVILEFLYHEIMEQDYTAIDARIIRNGSVIAHFANYDRQNFGDEIYANQSEEFEFPDQLSARSFLASAGTYHEVKTQTEGVINRPKAIADEKIARLTP
jgi:hypothetical protein